MKKNGFTLVELLVAIAIFAVLSALGWRVFDHIRVTRDQNTLHEQKLNQLQQGYQQILRDMVQTVPLTANVNGDIQPALVLQDGRFNFSKTGVTDPLEQGIAPDERVEYQYRADEQKIYRLKFRNLNQTGRDQPESSILLSDVEQFQITALNPNEITQWPESGLDLNRTENKQLLPKGIKINLIDDYLTPENVKEILSGNPDIILDCIDDVKAKFALMLHCRFNKIPLIVSGGAGGKLDPLKIRVADLSRTEQDPMLAKLRAQLRAKGIRKKPKEKFGITCVYSIDNPFSSADVCASAGLRCGGYGSAVVVTSSFAMVAVSEVLKKLDSKRLKA